MKRFETTYYNPSHPASFSRAENLKNVKGVDKNNVVPWLESQDAYTMHRLIRRRFPRRMYNVNNIDDVWEADLADLRSIATYNDGYKYILVVIDVLSKFAWIEPLHDKTSGSVTRAFSQILSRSTPRFPLQLQTDRGREFTGTPFQKFLIKKNIIFRAARNPDIKASIAERFNRTLKDRMWRYFTYTRNKRYINVLQKFVHAYNEARHSGTQMRPSEVTLENASIARENLARRYTSSKKKLQSKLPKYSVGDLVRISNAKAAFAKGYESGWTREIFKIHRISMNRQPFVYILHDLNNEPIDGIFYPQELSRVRVNSLSSKKR